MLNFIKTTILGGIIFLIPIVIFVAVTGKALHIIGQLTNPLTARIQTGTALDAFGAHLLAAVILVGLCFLFGFIAKARRARYAVDALESRVLNRIPAYSYLKARAESVVTPEDTRAMRAVVVRFDDSWQLAFEVERIDGGQAVVFLPGAPDPWSGSVCVVEADRVTALDTTVRNATIMLQRLGIGSGNIFAGAIRAPVS